MRREWGSERGNLQGEGGRGPSQHCQRTPLRRKPRPAVAKAGGRRPGAARKLASTTKCPARRERARALRMGKIRNVRCGHAACDDVRARMRRCCALSGQHRLLAELLSAGLVEDQLTLKQCYDAHLRRLLRPLPDDPLSVLRHRHPRHAPLRLCRFFTPRRTTMRTFRAFTPLHRRVDRRCALSRRPTATPPRRRILCPNRACPKGASRQPPPSGRRGPP